MLIFEWGPHFAIAEGGEFISIKYTEKETRSLEGERNRTQEKSAHDSSFHPKYLVTPKTVGRPNARDGLLEIPTLDAAMYVRDKTICLF